MLLNIHGELKYDDEAGTQQAAVMRKEAPATGEDGHAVKKINSFQRVRIHAARARWRSSAFLWEKSCAS